MRHRHWSRMVGVVLMRRSLRCMGRFLHTQASDDHRPESVPSRVGSIYKWSNSARTAESSERHCAWSRSWRCWARAIERTHLTMRLFNGRLTRKTLAFSKLVAMYCRLGGPGLQPGPTAQDAASGEQQRLSALATTLTCDGSWTQFGLFAWERYATCQHLTGRLFGDREARNPARSADSPCQHILEGSTADAY